MRPVESLAALPKIVRDEPTLHSGADRVEEGVRELGPWSALEGCNRDAYLEGWLALACRSIAGVRMGMIAVQGAAGEPADAVLWPNFRAPVEPLTTSVELALERRSSVALRCEPSEGGVEGVRLSVPVLVDDEVRAVVALEIAARTEVGLALALHQLRWGCGWLEVWFRRDRSSRDNRVLEQQRAALDLIACVLDCEVPAQALQAFCVELAQRLRADRVSVGFTRGDRVQIEAHSGGALEPLGAHAQRLEAAMDEALDEREPIVCGPALGEVDPVTRRAHLDLADVTGARNLLSLRLESGSRCIGALLVERDAPQGFEAREQALGAAVAAVSGPLLAQRCAPAVRASPRAGRIRRVGLPVLWCALALFLVAALVPIEHRIPAEARLASDSPARAFLAGGSDLPLVGGGSLPADDLVARLRLDRRDLALVRRGQRGELALDGFQGPMGLELVRVPVNAAESGSSAPVWVEARVDPGALGGAPLPGAQGRAWLAVGERSLFWRARRAIQRWLGRE